MTAVLSSLFIFTSTGYAAVNLSKYSDFSIVVNGNKFHYGDSKRSVEAILGKAKSRFDNTLTWHLPNRLTFSATFDEYGLSDASISGPKKYSNSYAIVYGEKFYLNSLKVPQLESTFNNTDRCLFRFDIDRVVGLEFEVMGGPEGSYYTTFVASTELNESTYDKVFSKNGLSILKQANIDTITMHQGILSSYSDKVYCK